MACDENILASIEELVKICKATGQSIDYEEPEDDVEGFTVMATLFGRVVSSMGGTPDAREITDEASAMGAITANLAYICKSVS